MTTLRSGSEPDRGYALTLDVPPPSLLLQGGDTTHPGGANLSPYVFRNR